MPASVRLDPELERLVQAAAHRTGQSKSEVIRAGVRAYCKQLLDEYDRDVTAYDLVAHILERDHGPRDPDVPTDLAANSEAYLRAGFAAEHAGRHHR